MNLRNKFVQKAYFQSKKKIIKHRHWILHIRISLGVKFHFKKAISFFLDQICPQEHISGLKVENWKYLYKVSHKLPNDLGLTIIIIILWDFWMFYQIFLPSQVKRYTIITYEHSIYELSHKLPKDLRLRILGIRKYQESV